MDTKPLPGAMGCPRVLSQDDLDQLHQLLVRGVRHGQIGIELMAGREFRFGTLTHRLGGVVRCNGAIHLELPPGEFLKILSVMWKGVVLGENCELVKRIR